MANICLLPRNMSILPPGGRVEGGEVPSYSLQRGDSGRKWARNGFQQLQGLQFPILAHMNEVNQRLALRRLAVVNMIDEKSWSPAFQAS